MVTFNSINICVHQCQPMTGKLESKSNLIQIILCVYANCHLGGKKSTEYSIPPDPTTFSAPMCPRNIIMIHCSPGPQAPLFFAPSLLSLEVGRMADLLGNPAVTKATGDEFCIILVTPSQ